MDASLDRRFPCAADIERAALRRMPRFIRDFIFCGMGQLDCSILPEQKDRLR